MQWLEWADVDAAIRREFGYAVEPDLAAARRLQAIVPPQNRLRDLTPIFNGRRDVAIVGCGPGLAATTPNAVQGKLVVAADGASSWLREVGIAPQVVVTDLDGDPDDLVWASQQGAAMVVHAHGDNVDALRDLAPLLGKRVYGTYQGPPVPGLAPLANVGGFTDGDRAVVLAEHFGARAATLIAFDFDKPPSPYSHKWDPQTKPKKLAWAKLIVEGVEERRKMVLTRV